MYPVFRLESMSKGVIVQVTPFWFINSHVMQKEADKKTWRKD